MPGSVSDVCCFLIGPLLVLIIVLIIDKANVTLNALRLEENRIGDEGAIALGQVLGVFL